LDPVLPFNKVGEGADRCKREATQKIVKCRERAETPAS